jgi:hypothetical protein
MPLPPRVVSAWLGDIAAASRPETSRRGKRSQVQEPQSQRRKRRALDKTTANMPRPRPSPPDSPDPLSSDLRASIQPSERASERSGQASSRETSVGAQSNVEKIKRPRGRPRKSRQQESKAVAGYASIEATGNLVLSPSTSQYSGSRYGEELASMGLGISEPTNSNTTASSSRRGKSRNPSPVKSLDDMHIFDKPISVGFVNGERPIPEVLQPHWDALENICANIGIIPRSIQVRYLQDKAIITLTICRLNLKQRSDCILLCYLWHRCLHRAKAFDSRAVTLRKYVRCGTRQ